MAALRVNDDAAARRAGKSFGKVLPQGYGTKDLVQHDELGGVRFAVTEVFILDATRSNGL